MNITQWERAYAAAKLRYAEKTSDARELRFSDPAASDKCLREADTAAGEMSKLMRTRPAGATIPK